MMALASNARSGLEASRAGPIGLPQTGSGLSLAHRCDAIGCDSVVTRAVVVFVGAVSAAVVVLPNLQYHEPHSSSNRGVARALLGLLEP